jgi:hypothetical protein
MRRAIDNRSMVWPVFPDPLYGKRGGCNFTCGLARIMSIPLGSAKFNSVDEMVGVSMGGECLIQEWHPWEGSGDIAFGDGLLCAYQPRVRPCLCMVIYKMALCGRLEKISHICG